jgi:hypothetical protein
MQEDKKLKKLFLVTSITLFLFSLTQKCYCTTSTCGDSIMVFLLGWAAIVSGGAGLSWIANPLLFASWLILKRNLKISMFLSVFAALLSLSFLLFDSVLDNEAGQKHQVVSYSVGYWFWTASSICMLIGTFVLMLRHNTRNIS